MSDKTRSEKISDLIQYLNGTFNTLEEGIKEIFGEEVTDGEAFLTEEDKAQIDHEIFLCDSCQWWQEQGDSGDSEGNCRDCLSSQGIDPDEEE